jgi:amino acid adenylation domain-containing protein/FkbM family methyltransferase
LQFFRNGNAATTLLTAVAAVLSRYGAPNNFALGFFSRPDKTPISILVRVDSSTRLRDLATHIDSCVLLNFGELESNLITNPTNGEGIDRNTFFDVAVAATTSAIADQEQDATVWFDASGEGHLCAEFSSRLFFADVIERFLKHVALMAKEFGDPCATVGAVDLSTSAERLIINKLNATSEPTLPETVHELFVRAAACQPRHGALIFKDQVLTNAEVDRRSNQLATVLRALGVRNYDRVGISLLPSAVQVISVLAIAKAGAVVVPFDPTFPRLRLATMIRDSGLKILLTEVQLRDRFPVEVHTVVLEDIAQELNEASSEALPIDVTPRNAFYMLYTSGSTGVPKAVVVPHTTLTNLITWQNEQTPTAGKRTLARSSIAFDVAFQEIFSTLCFGGTLVIATDMERADVSSMHQLLDRHKIARLFCPPVTLQQLAERVSTDPVPLPHLEWIIAAGEQLRITPAIVRFFRQIRARLINQYGPTETHVATSFVLDESPLRWPQLPPIGTPIRNGRIYVLDQKLRPVPVGTPGEIFIGGLLPALRYHARDDLTAQRFLPDPFAAPCVGNGRMYRTGDVGRLRNDGQLEFVGRTDDQVKMRGYRIELGDIESNALALPGIRQAAAKLWNSEGDAHLALYVATDPLSQHSSRSLRRLLEGRLPAHMVPSIRNIVVLPELPVNANGKIDRLRLPPTSTRDTREPLIDTLENRIGQIWTKRLKIAAVQPDDDFLEIGGHSLLAIQIVSEVNDAFGTTVPLSNLLRGGTLRRFTQTVQELLENQKRQGYAGPVQKSPSSMYKVLLPDGRTVFAPFPAEALYLWRDIFECKSYDRNGINFRSGDIVVDVGANIGLFSIYALDRAKLGGIVAIEPAAMTFAALSTNLQQIFPSAILVNAGCGNVDAPELTFSYLPHLPGMSSFYPDPKTDEQLLSIILKNTVSDGISDFANRGNDHLSWRLEIRSEKCPMRRLSSIIKDQKLERIDLLKVDVQHGEDRVLDGINEPHWSIVRQAVIEMQDRNKSLALIQDRLQTLGFETSVGQINLHRGTNIYYVYARKGDGGDCN